MSSFDFTSLFAIVHGLRSVVLWMIFVTFLAVAFTRLRMNQPRAWVYFAASGAIGLLQALVMPLLSTLVAPLVSATYGTDAMLAFHMGLAVVGGLTDVTWIGLLIAGMLAIEPTQEDL